jgi:isopenicillin N synthase-like dioxygenase
MAIILELPEDYLVNAHAYDKRSDDHLRYMIYNTRTQEEWDKAQGVTTGGHTDFGSLTLLFSQHIAGLQIRTPEGEWKWVKPVDGGITCNAADTLSFLTNGKFLTQFFMEYLANRRCRVCKVYNPSRCYASQRPDPHSSSRLAILCQTWR